MELQAQSDARFRKSFVLVLTIAYTAMFLAMIWGFVEALLLAAIFSGILFPLYSRIKRALKGSGAFAYRGPIMPKFIEKWREYPKKSYGSENKLDQEKYDRIRREVQAKMKRFDQPKK